MNFTLQTKIIEHHLMKDSGPHYIQFFHDLLSFIL